MIVSSMVPVWILWYLTTELNLQPHSRVPVMVVLVSNIIFFAVLIMVTQAKRHEVLAASAG